MGFSVLLDPQNKQVGETLFKATACMFTLPILTFYIVHHIFRNEANPDTYAGGAAILMTNVIVAAYCIHAFREDSGKDDDGENKNDADRPRVGAFKQRTD